MIAFERTLLFLVAIVAYGLLPAQCSAEKNTTSDPLPTIEALRERWKSECEGLDAFHVVVDYVFVQPRNAAVDTVTESVRHGGKRLKEVNGTLIVYNPADRIGFELQKSGKAGAVESSWILADVERTPPDASMYPTPDAAVGYDADMASYAYRAAALRYESRLYCLENIPLYKLLALDRVVSVDISRTEDGAIRLEASFVDDRAKAPRGNADFISGHIQRLSAKLDPVHYCLREAVADFNGEIGKYKSIRVVGEYDLDERGRTRPLLVRTELVDRYFPEIPNSDLPYAYELRYRRYERNPSIDDDIFTLEHYGLISPPSLKLAGSYRTPMWLYYFFGGVLCVAVGAFFAHRAVRTRS